MIYRRNKPTRSLVVLVVLGGLWLGGFFWYDQLSALALFVARPIWRVGARLDNQSLDQQLTELRLRLMDRDALAADNAALRALLGYYPAPPLVVVARILAHPWTSPYDILVVDSGSNFTKQIIAPGAEVLLYNTIALGRVAEVTGETAKIKLFSAGGNELPVLVGPERLPVVAEGRGGGNFLVELPREAKVGVGDTIYTEWRGRSLVVGNVGDVEKVSGASLQKIYFRYPINLNDLTLVEIQIP
ncbi:MAG: hypothetical protein HYT48_01245 [Candidatus Vogelbacteria bacterium]|nr:hypothetical protein [Candidatus Vogelbacteria bacterium]